MVTGFKVQRLRFRVHAGFSVGVCDVAGCFLGV